MSETTFVPFEASPSESPRKKQMTDKDDTLKLPGFGIHLDQESHLPIAQTWYASPTSVRERAMVGLMLALKDKPEWDRKVFDEDIVAKWRKEAMDFTPDHGPKGTSRGPNPWNSGEKNGENLDVDGETRQKKIDEDVFDYCIAELRDNAKAYRERGFTEAVDASACVYMSDKAVSAKTKSLLNRSVAPLENVKDVLKDWHPGSDGKVLDLVHPSLFPLIYGRSRILPDRQVPLEKCAWSTGEGEIVPKPDHGAADGDYSDNFQWLPCEVSLNANKKAKITSYINNLHPTGNEELYQAIEDVMTASVPLWVQTLLSAQFLASDRINHDFGDGWIDLPKPKRRVQRDDEETEHGGKDGEEEEYETDEDEYWDNQDLYHEVAIPTVLEYQTRQRAPRGVFETQPKSSYRVSDIDAPVKNPAIQPTPEQIAEGQVAMDKEAAKIQAIFAEKGFQVIVKLANIHLTPEKPNYDGGSWHIEGQLNEHICASALYYYNSENITDSYLAFREGVDRDELNHYEQNRYQALMEIYGIKDDWGRAIQVLGSVHTREDRLLVFPNVFQHRVSPFELQNKTRPGHRKLLALFLVDPFIRIPSTANVPPQQMDWWKKAMEEKGSLTQRVPVELADLIIDGVEDFPVTMEQAKGLREELIEERKAFVDSSMENFTENGYCFCEH